MHMLLTMKLRKMSDGERREVWRKAKEEVERQMRDDMGECDYVAVEEGEYWVEVCKKGEGEI